MPKLTVPRGGCGRAACPSFRGRLSIGRKRGGRSNLGTRRRQSPVPRFASIRGNNGERGIWLVPELAEHGRLRLREAQAETKEGKPGAHVGTHHLLVRKPPWRLSRRPCQQSDSIGRRADLEESPGLFLVRPSSNEPHYSDAEEEQWQPRVQRENDYKKALPTLR